MAGTAADRLHHRVHGRRPLIRSGVPRHSLASPAHLPGRERPGQSGTARRPPRPGRAPSGTRVDPVSLTERDHRAARAVSEVAAELGASPSQVAIAWTLARSRAVHPIVGARDAEQLADNLGAVDVDLLRGHWSAWTP
nr:aldo/keto reductase [Nocardiopsis alborubida]